MAVESAAPPRAQMVYNLLIVVGVIAAVVSAITVGVISYNYITRPELRNVEDHSKDEAHAVLPDWIARI